MSIHPSLSASLKNRKQRSVLKRTERIKYLKDKGLFNDETSSVFGLPKIKFVKIKIKKEKPTEKAAATAEGAAPAAAAAAAGVDKQAAKPAKGAAQAAKPAK